jgi:hypothetical protein
MVLMLALLWATATSHCRLESGLGLAALTCCDHQEVSDQHENDCHNNACDMVESGQYQSTLQRLTVPAPKLQLHFESPAPAPAALEPVAMLPHERSDTAFLPLAPWQFVFRAALPPRTPSALA